MNKNNIYLIAFVLLMLVPACVKKEEINKNIIAQIDDECLYNTDLIRILPDAISHEDSALFVENYINEWCFERLIYKEAQKNIDDTTELSVKINDYRRQLYVHYYLEQLLNAEIKLSVDSVEIANYYSTHLNNYVLPATFIKAHYIVIGANIATYYNVIEKLKSTTLDDVQELEKYCSGTERKPFFIEKWTNFNDFLTAINYQSKIADEEIRKNNIIDIVVKDKRYIIKIDNIVPKASIAPLELIYDDIIQIIINNRKKEKFAKIKNKIINDNVK
jgi:hypothetical protein